MGHFRSNLRDIEFNLFEVNGLADLLGRGPYAQMDADTARSVLAEVERLATEVFAESFTAGDRTPLRLEDGEVVIPDAVKASLDAYSDGEWYRLYVPEHLGGYGAPPSLGWSATELLCGADGATMMYTAGPFFASIVDPLVTDEQRERWVRPMVDRRWGGTMVLTEPDAGSDVGASRTTAVDAGDGTWHLSGVKRFITNGDFDWAENIVHLVLARPVTADGTPMKGPGTKGLSLFIVPKLWVTEDGGVGERNGVAVRKVEDKMGLKASATCELTFGDERPARGVLVGDVHDGIRQMFKVIEYARMLVGTKAMATLSTGYLNALDYAKDRVQGADLARAGDKTAPRVEIIRHPDVRRMLMDCKAHVEGMRALVLYTASVQDRLALDPDNTDLARRNDLLLPMVKGYGSEKSYELLAVALQVFGGSGYCRDYPMEQYIRDAKIDTLYEGTTGIQGLDLFFRKVGRDQGETLGKLLAEVQETAKGDAGNGALAEERARLATALEDVGAMLGALVGFARQPPGESPRSQPVHLVGLNTTPLLGSLSELLIGWLLVRQAEIALAALGWEGLGDGDRSFYEGKVASARWFARTVLPQLSARRAVVESTDAALMELDDAAF